MNDYLSDPDFPMRNESSIFSSLVMDEVSIILITEGKDNDPYVYSKLIEANISKTSIKYEIVKIENIDLSQLGIEKGSSGKQPIKSLYHHLDGKNELKGRLGVEKYYSILAMDKDLDDVKGDLIISDHVTYTPNYDVESVMFQNVDFVELVCVAGCIDRPTVQRQLKIKSVNDAAAIWLHWAVLCYANDVLKIGYTIGFKISRINSPYHQIASRENWESYRNSLISTGIAKGLSSASIEKALEDGMEYFSKGDALKIFKGKWFINIISSEINTSFSGMGYDIKSIEAKLKASLRSKVDYSSATWREFAHTISLAEIFVS